MPPLATLALAAWRVCRSLHCLCLFPAVLWLPLLAALGQRGARSCRARRAASRRSLASSVLVAGVGAAPPAARRSRLPRGPCFAPPLVPAPVPGRGPPSCPLSRPASFRARPWLPAPLGFSLPFFVPCPPPAPAGPRACAWLRLSVRLRSAAFHSPLSRGFRPRFQRFAVSPSSAPRPPRRFSGAAPVGLPGPARALPPPFGCCLPPPARPPGRPGRRPLPLPAVSLLPSARSVRRVTSHFVLRSSSSFFPLSPCLPCPGPPGVSPRAPPAPLAARPCFPPLARRPVRALSLIPVPALAPILAPAAAAASSSGPPVGLPLPAARTPVPPARPSRPCFAPGGPLPPVSPPRLPRRPPPPGLPRGFVASLPASAPPCHRGRPLSPLRSRLRFSAAGLGRGFSPPWCSPPLPAPSCRPVAPPPRGRVPPRAPGSPRSRCRSPAAVPPAGPPPCPFANPPPGRGLVALRALSRSSVGSRCAARARFPSRARPRRLPPAPSALCPPRSRPSWFRISRFRPHAPSRPAGLGSPPPCPLRVGASSAGASRALPFLAAPPAVLSAPLPAHPAAGRWPRRPPAALPRACRGCSPPFPRPRPVRGPPPPGVAFGPSHRPGRPPRAFPPSRGLHGSPSCRCPLPAASPGHRVWCLPSLSLRSPPPRGPRCPLSVFPLPRALALVCVVLPGSPGGRRRASRWL